MAGACSWLIFSIVFLLTIHFIIPEGECKKDKKGDKKGDDSCECEPSCESCCDPCCEPHYGRTYGGRKYCHEPCCSSSSCCDDNDDCDDKKAGKKEKKIDKLWKKLMKKEDKKEGKKDKKDKKDKKSKTSCCGDDDECQKIIIEHGPAIIQTIIMDEELYRKYCNGCYRGPPIQKVIVHDEVKCCKDKCVLKEPGCYYKHPTHINPRLPAPCY